MSIRSLLERRPLSFFFILTLGWISVYTLLAYRFIPPDMPDGLGSVPPWLMVLLMFGMPSVIGLALTALKEGKSGIKTLLGRLWQLKVQPKLFAAAVLIPAFVYGSAYVLQSWLGGPDPVIRLDSLTAGVGSGIFSCLFEELGWRGFVLPRLLNRTTPLKAGLLTGLGWGAWHFMLNYIGMRQYGTWMLLLSFLAGPVLLTGFAVLMAWVFKRAKGSLLLMVLFHLSITTNAIFLSLQAPILGDALRQNLVICVVVWLVVGCVALQGGFNAKKPETIPSVHQPMNDQLAQTNR